MHIKNQLFVFATLSMAALSAGPAAGTTITTDAVWTGGTSHSLFTSWQTNPSGGVTGATELPAFASGSLPGYNADGSVTFASAIGSFTASGASFVEATYGSFPALEGQAINIATPAAGINAFYVAFGSTDGSPITVTLSDGEAIALNPTPTAGGEVVLGLSISHPITSIVISSTDASAVLWDFDYGSSNLAQDSTPTPAAEAATAILIGIGLVTFGAGRKLFSALAA